MKTEDYFLPEVGISIINTEIDTDELTAEDALGIYELVMKRLCKLNSYYGSHEEEAMKSFYRDEVTGDTFDVFDFLPSAIAELREYYPTMTEQQLIKQLEHDEYLDANIGF